MRSGFGRVGTPLVGLGLTPAGCDESGPADTADLGCDAGRLVENEAWVHLHAYGRAATHGPVLAATLAHQDLPSLDERVCGRCRAPFPVLLRTLDALHLATADFLRSQGFTLDVATYDDRLGSAATAMGLGLAH